jgi:outer membrane receptor protein involved in Fe transport
VHLWVVKTATPTNTVMKPIAALSIALIFVFCADPMLALERVSYEPGIPGQLVGQVTDTLTGQGLEYASVLLFSGKDSLMAAGTITGLRGFFRFDDLPPGEYYLVARYHGYRPAMVEHIHLNDGRGTKDLGSIVMQPDPTVLPALKVEGNQGAITYHLDKQVINASQIMDGGSGTAVSLLQNSPSVTVNQDNQVMLRGSGNFMLLVDGKTVMIQAGDALQQIPSSQVERIEIITSPSARYDAEGSAGIIHVILKKDRGVSTSGLVNFRLATYDKYNLDGAFNLNRRKLSLNVSAGAYLNNGYPVSLYEREFEDGELTWMVKGDNRIRRKRDGAFLRASADWKPSSTLSISPWADISWFGFMRNTLTLYEDLSPGATLPLYSLSRDHFVLNGLPRNFGLQVHKDLDTSGQYLEVNLTRSQWNGINDNYIHRYQSTFGWDEQRLLSSRSYEEDNVQDDIQGKVEYAKKWKRISLETGVQLTFRPTECNYTTQNLDPDTMGWIPDSLYSGQHTFTQTKYAAYGTLSGAYKAINILVGLRTEHYFRTFTLPNVEEVNRFEHTYWFPSFHLGYGRAGKSQLQFSFNRRISYPTDWTLTPNPFLFDGYTIQTGNPELRPELINNLEINYLKYFGEQVFNITGYYRRHEDAIVRTLDMTQPPTLTMGYDNIPHSEYAGLELGSNLRLQKIVSLNFSLNFYHEKVSRMINNRLVPGHLNAMQARAILNYKLSKTTRMQASFQYFGPAQEGTSTRHAMHGINLSIKQDFLQQKLSATLQASDLFHTMVYKFTYEEDGTSSIVTWTPEYPNISLSLSYRINDYKPQQTSQIPTDNGAGMTP